MHPSRRNPKYVTAHYNWVCPYASHHSYEYSEVYIQGEVFVFKPSFRVKKELLYLITNKNYINNSEVIL